LLEKKGILENENPARVTDETLKVHLERQKQLWRSISSEARKRGVRSDDDMPYFNETDEWIDTYRDPTMSDYVKSALGQSVSVFGRLVCSLGSHLGGFVLEKAKEVLSRSSEPV
jgi:hypothetical protein